MPTLKAADTPGAPQNEAAHHDLRYGHLVTFAHPERSCDRSGHLRRNQVAFARPCGPPAPPTSTLRPTPIDDGDPDGFCSAVQSPFWALRRRHGGARPSWRRYSCPENWTTFAPAGAPSRAPLPSLDRPGPFSPGRSALSHDGPRTILLASDDWYATLVLLRLAHLS